MHENNGSSGLFAIGATAALSLVMIGTFVIGSRLIHGVWPW